MIGTVRLRTPHNGDATTFAGSSSRALHSQGSADGLRVPPRTTSMEPHDKHLKTDDQHHHHEHDIEDIDPTTHPATTRRTPRDAHPQRFHAEGRPSPPNDELKQQDTLAGCALRNLRVSLRRVTEDE